MSLSSSNAMQYLLFAIFGSITVYNIIAYIMKRKKIQQQQRNINIKIQSEQARVQEKLKEMY